ncbi:MAG: ABC transporter ATP-binding protein [Cryomorphaceae bacterium]|nr:MAG: ABC transporter ATP-binding protein [Cryomorphaceae bacterium]
MTFVKPYRGVFYFTFALTILSALIGVVRPILVGKAIDVYILEDDSLGLLILTLIVVAVLLLEAVVQFYQTYFSNWLGQNVTIDLRSNLFRHITAFKLRYFDKTPIGQLVTRVVSDIETVADIFSQGILVIMGDLLKLVVVVVAMFVINWKLTLFVLIPIPLLLVATNIFKNAIKKAFQQVRTQVAVLNTFVQEHITGMNIVQIFNREEEEARKFREINQKHRQAHIRSVWAYSIFFPVVEILSAISLAVLVWWGTRESLKGEVTVGELVAFILFIYMLFRPIRQLADRFNVLQMGMVGSQRVFNVLDTDERIVNNGTIEKESLKGNISFQNVWFAYKDDDFVLRDVSFEVNQGEVVAFVGATGAGKSSVINLLSRFYEFQKGEILIDETPIRDYDLNYLRSEIAVVLQDVFLFSDTIHNNITLGDDRISREQVIEAAKVVSAHGFISRLPGGYDFDVKERGGMLSTGQRQLISFIRAYVYNPGILVLDEATSSVDTETEMLIQDAIDQLTKGRTSIVIAHRLSTIQKADRIIVMDKGKVLESGSHNQLLEKAGAYRRLFDMQFKR